MFAVVAIGLLLLAVRQPAARRRAARRGGRDGVRARCAGPGAAARAGRPARRAVRAHIARRAPGARVLRLHPLPRRLPRDRRRLNQVLADAGPGRGRCSSRSIPTATARPRWPYYLTYLPDAYTGLSGTPDAIARNAGAWGVKYAKVDEGSDDGYGMAHTADVFLVDAAGRLRARFPFGTDPAPMTTAVAGAPRRGPRRRSCPGRRRQRRPAATSAALAGGSGPGDDLRVLVVSSSIWAGPETPIIVTLTEPDGTPLDGSQAVVARVIGANETATAPDVTAVAIRPTGAKRASFVATVQIPVAGWWRLDLVTADGRKGSVADRGAGSGRLGRDRRPAPAIDTPTLEDVGGKALAITTQEAPDLRLYEESTADARAAGRPYVLVVDSARFKVSPACGRAITMVGYLVDRWPDDVAFVHLEPFQYQVVTEAPILDGRHRRPAAQRADGGARAGRRGVAGDADALDLRRGRGRDRAREVRGDRRQRRHRPDPQPHRGPGDDAGLRTAAPAPRGACGSRRTIRPCALPSSRSCGPSAGPSRPSSSPPAP